MTALEAIHELDSLKPNTFSQEQKLQWLDRLDSFLYETVLKRYGDLKAAAPVPGNPDRELLMEAPFDEGYLHWMESKIHYFNEEIDRYNAAVRMFQSVFEDFQRHVNRIHSPENPGVFRF